MKPIFITGIGTGIGKTIVSAILVEKLKADYWKPVQSGDLDDSDTDKVKRLISNHVSIFYPEAYRLTQPFSPHKSAELDNVRIEPDTFILPETGNKLIIEGAGGLLVPLNSDYFIADLIAQTASEAILVSRNYLGSINHTLMSIEILKARGIPLKGIIFNGPADRHSEEVIKKYSKVSYFAHIPEQQNISKATIAELGKDFESWDI